MILHPNSFFRGRLGCVSQFQHNSNTKVTIASFPLKYDNGAAMLEALMLDRASIEAVGAYVLSSSCCAVNVGWWRRQSLEPMKEPKPSLSPAGWVPFLTGRGRIAAAVAFHHAVIFKVIPPCSFYEIPPFSIITKLLAA